MTSSSSEPARTGFPARPVAQLLGSAGPVHCVTYSASPGTYVLTGSADRAVRLYNPSSTTLPSSSSSFITASSNSKRPPQAVVPVGKHIQTYTSHGYAVLCVAVSHDNQRFVSGSAGDRAVFLWDVQGSAGSSGTTQSATGSATTAGAISDSTATYPIRRFGSSGSSHGPSPHAHVGRVNAVCFAGPGDDLILSGGADCVVRIWDVRASIGGGGSGGGTYGAGYGSGYGGGGGTGKPIQTLSEARDAVTAICVPDSPGWEVLVASVDGRVRTYDVRAGRCVVDVVSPASAASAATLPASAAGNDSVGGDGAVVGGTGSGITALDASRGAYLATSLDGRIRLMDRRQGTCLKTYGDAAAGAVSGSDAKSAGRRTNSSLRIQSVLGGGERWVVSGDEMFSLPPDAGTANISTPLSGRIWAWDLLSGNVVCTLDVPWSWGGAGTGGPPTKLHVGRDGRARQPRNVVTALAWQDSGRGAHFCAGGTSGVVTVYGPATAAR